MAKTQKELAFLRDLYIQENWTARFTEAVDKHIDLSDSENLLYINAGTGTHALTLDEKWGEKLDIFAAVENEDELTIARDKAAAVSSKVDFSTIRFEDDAFDAVLADATFVAPGDVEEFVENAVRVARTGGDVAVFLPSAGSYGEIFSLLWEVMFNEDLGEHGHAVEQMISDLPTLSSLEEIATRAGMVNIQTEAATEIFEYDNAAEFLAAPLIEDYLLPMWLDTFEEEDMERVTAQLSKLIDEEDGPLTFRFTVKAALLTGEKG